MNHNRTDPRHHSQATNPPDSDLVKQRLARLCVQLQEALDRGDSVTRLLGLASLEPCDEPSAAVVRLAAQVATDMKELEAELRTAVLGAT